MSTQAITLILTREQYLLLREALRSAMAQYADASAWEAAHADIEGSADRVATYNQRWADLEALYKSLGEAETATRRRNAELASQILQKLNELPTKAKGASDEVA